MRSIADGIEQADVCLSLVSDAALPLLISLGSWTQEEQSLTEFIRQQVGVLGEHLEGLLQAQRALPVAHVLPGMHK